MTRYVPNKIEVKTKLLKNLTITDFLIIILGLFISSLVIFSSINYYAKLAICAGIIFVIAIFVMEINTKKGYQMIAESFAYIIRKKKTLSVDFENSKKLQTGPYLKVDGLYVAIIEVNGVDLAILDEESQDSIIAKLGSVIETMTEGSFVKYDKPVDFTPHLQTIDEDIKNLDILYPNECKAKECRRRILETHRKYIQNYQDSGENQDCYYVIAKEKKEVDIQDIIETLMAIFKDVEMGARVIEDKEQLAFLADFFQKENCYYTPSLIEKYNSITIGGVEKQIVSVGKYPFVIGNAWASELFSIEGVTAVFNFKKYGGKNIEKNLHKAIREINGSILTETKNQSNQRRAMGQAEILNELVDDIVFKGEEIYDTQLYLMFDKNRSKEILKIIKHCKVSIDYCFGIQKEAYLNMLPYKSISSDIKRYNFIQMPCATVAGAYPFIYKKINDESGTYIGYNRNFIFYDVFLRDKDRLNGNMCIFGESGAGKSFTLKKLISENASKGVKIYILDPEDEYRYLTANLDGNYLDVAGTKNTKINLLQVFPSLKDEEGNDIDDLQQHRVFLEQILQLIFPEMPIEQRLYLNRLIGVLYDNFGITAATDILKLKNNEFPTCDDLLKLVVKYAEKKDIDESERRIYNSLRLYIEQLAEGGVYSNIWNGYTTLELNNSLNVLNFRSLFSNSNRKVANAQMLLVMRFLNLEIIKNKTYNDIHCNDDDYVPSRCMVIADEAHNFIDSKFPVALDFMRVMSKQIRKYGGVFWIATQNIGDFVGQTDEVKAKATAVIDNCKLALIFGLQPNDINTMIDLYKSSRPFTEREKEILRNGKRGKGLFKINDKTRVPIQIEAFEEQITVFEK